MKALILFALAAPIMAQTSTINWTSPQQTIVGFGGANQGQFADMSSATHSLVFGNGSGQLGLSVLRSGVADSGGDFGDCTTINSNCAGRITDTQAVAAAGGIMIGMPLSPPASMKTNGSTTCTGGSGSGMLKTASYGAFATYLSNWIASVKNFAGVTPYALSVQNEPDFCPPYDGTLYSGSQLQTFIKTNLGPTLAANGQTSTLISLSDAAHYSGLPAVADPCAGDSACNAFVGAYSFHPYDATVSGSTATNMPLPSGLSTGNGYWATEMSQGSNYGPACGSYTSFTNTIQDAQCWGAIVDQLLNNNANMVLYWQIVDFGGTAPPTATNGSLISNAAAGSVVAKRAYMLAQYSKFVRPGYQRIAATARPLSNVSVTAYKSGNNLSAVLTNYDASPHAITLNLTNAPTFTSLTPTITSATQNIVALSSVAVSSNSLTYTVPAQSIVTLTGTGSTGTTVNAASCNQPDVMAALNFVTSATTTVNLPAGVCNWTVPINWTVPAGNSNLTIQGATVINCTGTAGTSNWACTPTDNTVIKDSITTGPNSTPLVINVANTAAFLRVTGISFLGGTGVVKNDGIFNVNGQTHNLRIDHVNCNTTTYSASFSTFCTEVHGDITGVFDHYIGNNGGSGTTSNSIGAFNAVGDTIGFGDGTWAQATGFGGSGFLFIESSVFMGGEAQDCADGGKFVLRYSMIINGSNGSAPIHEHGTKTQGGRGRGCRAYEAYNNYNAGPSPNADALVGAAGGTALIYHNTLATGRNWFMAWSTTRNDGSASETNTPNGWGYCGTTINGNGVGSAWDGNTNAGTGYPCMDAVGRGQGQAMNGQNWPGALNSVTGTISWLHQFREPDYVFGNTILNGAAGVRINSGGGADTDNNGVYWDAGSGHSGCSAAFNGTCGTGHGNAASRPSTCTAGPGGTFDSSPIGSYGVAYYEDDTGLLDICTATNTWGQQFNPSFTYPHPLAGGVSACADPSQNAPFSGGPYSVPPPLVITWTNPTAGCVLHYTVDGSAPTSASPTYPGGGLSISATTTVRVVAIQPGFTNSGIQGGTWTITSALPMPFYSPLPGTYSTVQLVTLSDTTAGSTICYTTDGSTVTTNGAGVCVHGTTYSGPITVGMTLQIQAIATKSGNTDSVISAATYTINLIQPPSITISGIAIASGNIISK